MKLFIEKITLPKDADVSPSELEYAESLKSQKRKNEFLCGRALLRRVAREEYGCPDINIVFNGKKPVLQGEEFHFSISHSGDMLALVTSKYPVGVDIEYINPQRNIEKIIKRFSPSDQKKFFELPQDERLEYFYTLWTMYESFIKLQGRLVPSKVFESANCGAKFQTQKVQERCILTIAAH